MSEFVAAIVYPAIAVGVFTAVVLAFHRPAERAVNVNNVTPDQIYYVNGLKIGPGESIAISHRDLKNINLAGTFTEPAP